MKRAGKKKGSKQECQLEHRKGSAMSTIVRKQTTRQVHLRLVIKYCRGGTTHPLAFAHRPLRSNERLLASLLEVGDHVRSILLALEAGEGHLRKC